MSDKQPEWHKVPKPATAEMIKAMMEAEHNGYRAMYNAAIAAAPAQPAAQELCNCPAGSKPEPHKHAPNCPYRTGAQDQGEVQRLREKNDGQSDS